jgi:hypothetical protein
MPNWVSNTIIAPNRDLMDRLFHLIVEEEEGDLYIDFEKIDPIPISIPIAERSFWMLRNWGTNRSRAIEVYRDGVDLSFETAWTPIVPLVLKISTYFNDVYADAVWQYIYNDGENSESVIIENGEIIERENLIEDTLLQSELESIAYSSISLQEIRDAVANVDFDENLDESQEMGLWDLAKMYVAEEVDSGSSNYEEYVTDVYQLLWRRAQEELLVFKIKTAEDLLEIPEEELEDLSDKELEKLAEIGNEE